MGKRNGTKLKVKPVGVDVLDATPERLAHDPHVMVDVELSRDGSRRTTAKVRQFRNARIDRLYHPLGAISWQQHYAGNWWSTQREEGLGNPRVVADYCQSFGGGSGDPSPIPLTDKAETARANLAKAKLALSLQDRAAIEEVLDEGAPVLAGSSAQARMIRWRSGLQALAVYLKVA